MGRGPGNAHADLFYGIPVRTMSLLLHAIAHNQVGGALSFVRSMRLIGPRSRTSDKPVFRLPVELWDRVHCEAQQEALDGAMHTRLFFLSCWKCSDERGEGGDWSKVGLSNKRNNVCFISIPSRVRNLAGKAEDKKKKSFTSAFCSTWGDEPHDVESDTFLLEAFAPLPKSADARFERMRSDWPQLEVVKVGDGRFEFEGQEQEEQDEETVKPGWKVLVKATLDM
ncbi:hypothetical protein JCM8097_006781 [Rhodosporidiobolus ruineniae]